MASNFGTESPISQRPICIKSLQGSSNRTICTFIGKSLDKNDTISATDIKEKYFQTVIFATSLLTPLVAILALYINMLIRLWRGSAALGQGPGPLRDARNSGKNQENKKRVTRMIVAVIIVFTVCWTPFQIVLVLKAFGLYDDHKYESLVIFEIIMRCLAYGNSCLNPLLYAFFSPNFRSAFIQALSKSSLREMRDRNSRKKSSSGGRARTSKDINPENSGSLLGRSKFAAENRLAKVSIELQPLSTNTPEVTVKMIEIIFVT